MRGTADRDSRFIGGVGTPVRHDSAVRHVTGRALYIDDLPEPPRLLHVYIAMSERAHARITKFDVDAVAAAPGVAAIITTADIPGTNDVSANAGDEPVFAAGEVAYAGHPLFAVAAESREQARAAAARAQIEYAGLDPVLTIADAQRYGSEIEPPQCMSFGDAAQEIAAAPRRMRGRVTVGGQDHFYLEGQVCLVIPQEGGDLHVFSSTQHPSEVQHTVAKVLGKRDADVTVEVRRMGGGFGGKETQPALFAAIAALAAEKTGRPVKVRLDRDDDMIMTGKRHDFEIDYDAGYDGEGRIKGVEFGLASRCGYSTDLSRAVNDRAMFHADNAYFLNAATILSRRYRTNMASNTAFRGFGGPQGMLGIERIMDAIAIQLGKDPLDIRKLNLYGGEGRNLTPYHQIVEDSILPELIDRLEKNGLYRERRAAIRAFNDKSPYLKRGIALTPVKFGISFTTTHLNQAGALVHVYTDGSIHLNHGGTEMGQGLMTKVAQVVAEEFQVDLDRVKITATTTGKVPNTSPTAASSGSDINGMAAQNAARTIKNRLIAFAAEFYACAAEQVTFADNHVVIANHSLTFEELVRQAYLNRVSLSATGFYKTPKIHYDRKTHRGRPFFYYAYGAAIAEVMLDTLTGENKVLQVDVLHDVGASLNPAVDLGQIEGGFIQGMGWLTTEELKYDGYGRLLTHAPSTYKIPVCGDRPAAFNIALWDRGRNTEQTVYRSKAVGEPPLMLALSVFSALYDAVANVANHKIPPQLDAPATPESTLRAINELRTQAKEMQP